MVPPKLASGAHPAAVSPSTTWVADVVGDDCVVTSVMVEIRVLPWKFASIEMGAAASLDVQVHGVDGSPSNAAKIVAPAVTFVDDCPPAYALESSGCRSVSANCRTRSRTRGK